MPINKYFKGSGDKVFDKMESGYGKKKGKDVFYAAANKMKMKPKKKVKDLLGMK